MLSATAMRPIGIQLLPPGSIGGHYVEEPCPYGMDHVHHVFVPYRESTPAFTGGGTSDDSPVIAHQTLSPSPPPPPAQLPAELPPVQPCSFWGPGQVFEGTQRLSLQGLSCGLPTDPALIQDAWQVKLEIHQCDWPRGYACGTMTASTGPATGDTDSDAGAPGSSTSQANTNVDVATVQVQPVQTFWEAEVVDNVNHTFWTHDWGASHSVDIHHWSRCPGWQELRADALSQDGRAEGLGGSRYLYLRLKERHFLAPPQPALTISGFYYLCLDRHTGRLTGQYYDAASSPFELDMQIRGAVHGGGFAFPSYEMA